MHADHVEERLAVDVPAGAGGARHHVRTEVGFRQILPRRLGGRSQRLAEFGDPRGLQIGFAAHDRCDAGSVVAAGVGVVGQARGHQQRARLA